MRLDLRHMTDSDRRSLVGKKVRFFVPWSPQERSGTITRVGPQTLWVGAYCYHHNDLRNLREQGPLAELDAMAGDVQ